MAALSGLPSGHKEVIGMDLVSVVLIAVVALALIWLAFKAFSNSRHSPPTRLRGGQHGGFSVPGAGDYGFGESLNQDAPSGSTARGWKPRPGRSENRDDPPK